LFLTCRDCGILVEVALGLPVSESGRIRVTPTPMSVLSHIKASPDCNPEPVRAEWGSAACPSAYAEAKAFLGTLEGRH